MSRDSAPSRAEESDPGDLEAVERRWAVGLRRAGIVVAVLSGLALQDFWEGPCLTPFWRTVDSVLLGFGVVLAIQARAIARFLAPRELTREHLYSLALALAMALTIRTFVVQAFKIPSGSMLPTLQVGDHLLVSKFLYGVRVPFTNHVLRVPRVRDPERGDIVVFRYPEDECVDYIKRIVGLPGETIEVKDRRILIDGEPIEDPWGRCDDPERLPIHDPEAICSSQPEADDFRAFKIPEDRYFMMGDNRQNSKDSRLWRGARTVHRDKIVGKAWRIYWSWTREDGLRSRRVGDRVE